MPKDSLLNISKMYKPDFDLLRQASQVSVFSDHVLRIVYYVNL